MVGKGRWNMARHTWERPYEYGAYLNKLENPEHPDFELVAELDVGRGSFNGAGHAWVVYDRANGVECLQSYGTIVSVRIGGQVEHLGKWTPTTSRHQCRYACQYGN